MHSFKTKAGTAARSRLLPGLGLGLMLSLPGYAADPHVHGIAQLQIAVDQDQVDLIFSSPAANLLGFEHAPKTAPQRQTLEEAAAYLNSQPLIGSRSGSCQLDAASVSSELIGRGAGTEHQSGHENKHEHEEDETSRHEHHEQGHDGDAAGQVSHTDFRVIQQLSCSGDWREELRTGLLERFGSIESLQVQWVSRSGQGSSELAPDNAQIDLQ